jgi:glycosyltransferase involved in cell wall biosynthesis
MWRREARVAHSYNNGFGMTATRPVHDPPSISVIIPARNEESCLAACLHSLIGQAGVAFEIIVVDDHSTDRTREIASSFSSQGVGILEAGPLPANLTGKNNALVTGTKAARGQWLLFTDADTIHLPGSLANALAEVCDKGADLLSYSPEQIAVSFWEMATLPVIFAELARRYPPAKVSDPASPMAAANGQYILITRQAYDAVGGHSVVADQILEDVALARAVKGSGRKIFFRYAADAVRARMYRNLTQLREGWTKNLALLFPHPGWLAVSTVLLWALPWVCVTFALVARHWWWGAIGMLVFSRNAGTLRRANFDLSREFLGALFGMPMFAYLLLRSRTALRSGKIAWKGRTYSGSTKQDASASRHPSVAKQQGSLAIDH